MFKLLESELEEKVEEYTKLSWEELERIYNNCIQQLEKAGGSIEQELQKVEKKLQWLRQLLLEYANQELEGKFTDTSLYEQLLSTIEKTEKEYLAKLKQSSKEVREARICLFVVGKAMIKKRMKERKGEAAFHKEEKEGFEKFKKD